MQKTIFDQIINGDIKSYVVWEDDAYLAFLTPFPNTPGVTVVIPKINPGADIFHLDDKIYTELMLAAKQVASLLERALGVPRVAMVFEGTGVAHVHAKLYPLYGELAAKTGIWSDQNEFVEQYRGYITTLEGPQMAVEKLQEMQQKIIAASSGL